MKLLDLFAGTGVGVAAHWLGVPELGVEIWEPAFQTREAVGFQTPYRDVWEIERAETLDFDSMWASPPCQTFSVAGKGTGRKALDDVVAGVADRRWLDMDSLRELGSEVGDDRTALVLTPLAYAHRYRPRVIALEQVPTVLPVWEAYVGPLEEMGYSVWVGYLNAEQYGVPQTRKRAYLIARLDGEAKPPRPTHSRYYPRSPERLDPGVKKWVSMAEALGWDGGWLVSNYGTGGDASNRGVRLSTGPSATISSKFDRNKWSDGRNVTVDEGAALQSYPVLARKNMGRGMVERHGERPGRGAGQPAFTIRGSAGGTEPGGFIFLYADGSTRKITSNESSVIQSYVAPFPFRGNKSEVALQIGNAVPPLVAKAVLEESMEG